MKKIIILSVALLCMATITGCREKSVEQDTPEISADTENIGTEDTVEKSQERDQTQIENDLIYLTSEECAGRKAGTQGNEKAADYIIKRYDEIGLAPFGENYRNSYNERIETIDSDHIKLEILEDDTTVKALAFGKDFIEVFLNDTNLTLPLLEEPGSVDCAVMTGTLETIEELKSNPKVKLILRLNESYRRAGNFYIEKGIPEIGIFPDAYEDLKKHVGNSVRFSADVDTEDMVLDNIVGMLKGKDSSHALIVSAHFDHAGNAGETVWRGSYDNASGVCVLLEAAKELLDYYQGSLPPYDILFCAFNSEENSRTGSIAFSEQIKDKYETVFDINLDCVGAKGAASLNIIANKNEISNQIKMYLVESLSGTALGTVIDASDGGGSDHQSFRNAVCLSTITDMTSSKIHTLEDTPEKIDTEYLLQLGNGIASFILYDLDMTELFTSPQSRPEAAEANDGLLTATEFEELYHCKLDFADDRLLNIQVNLGQLEEDSTDTPPALEDARIVNLHFTDGQDNNSIDYFVYNKNDSMEMSMMPTELKAMRYDDDYALSPILLNNSKYYLSSKFENHFRFMNTFYENENRIIRVSVVLSGTENDKEEDYINYFQEQFPEEYISGMAKLLLSNSKDE